MIIIDGSAGEGGGQILRTALSLAMITGQAFRIDNIRGNRPKPGLMRQHLTCVDAACVISNGTCEGLSIGSEALTFRPGRVQPGTYEFAIGTAGNTSLVLQTLLLPLALADSPSTLIIDGGTHTLSAPPFDFIDRCFLPIVDRMGPKVDARLIQHGFYPRGGGRISASISPAALSPITLLDRGAFCSHSATIINASLPDHVAAREREALQSELCWPAQHFHHEELPAEHGPGNAVILEAQYEHVTEIVTGIAKLGVPARRLAHQAAARLRGYEKSSAFAGPYLADQLLLPMAVAGGGRFTTVKPSLHTTTNIDVIAAFTQRKATITQRADGPYLVEM